MKDTYPVTGSDTDLNSEYYEWVGEFKETKIINRLQNFTKLVKKYKTPLKWGSLSQVSLLLFLGGIT